MSNAIRLVNGPLLYQNGALLPDDGTASREKTMAWSILQSHNTSGNPDKLKIRFDGMASHDITYVGIIQTARASGMTRFPLPYVLTCCHNSLCAVGGTINADDHTFGLSAAKKYGGTFVPPHIAVIHQYMREMMAGCGKMLLGSDSHTRYGALGTLGVGEGGPELAKQLVGRTYDIDTPEVIAIHLSGTPAMGVGPQDVALAIIGEVFKNGFVKNKVMEFVGPGIANLPMDYRLGIDVMTTETTCLTSIWETDETVREYLAIHGRESEYAKLTAADGAKYDGAVMIDLSAMRPMIALPFHPSNTYEIAEFLKNPGDYLREVEKEAAANGMVGCKLTDKVVDGKVLVDQGVIGGCAGGLFDNLCAAADVLRGKSVGTGAFTLNAYPASQPVYLGLIENGAAADLIAAGAAFKTAFCGPCFGAGDVPRNNGLSIRHTTRNFPNREGSKPGDRQAAAVALMDARSIAATAAAGGVLTSADALPAGTIVPVSYKFNDSSYKNRVYNGIGQPDEAAELVFGPNITDWPQMPHLTDHLLLKFASVIHDPVTTTDELIPSGETSSYRSNPLRLAEFALSRKDPDYVPRAKACAAEDAAELLAKHGLPTDTMLKSVIFATKPGDGSAREQAASCQRVLGGGANVAVEYATKRYRSNLINWGMLPLRLKNADDSALFAIGDYLFLKDIRSAIAAKSSDVDGLLLKADGSTVPVAMTLDGLTDAEREILLAGSLINYYAQA